jgi:ribonuclease HI
MWIVYSDGACSKNPGPAGWGAVVLPADGKPQSFSGFLGHGTNQIAELSGAIEGLANVPEGSEVELVSDSQYVLKGLAEWRAGWERRNFVNSKGDPVANQALWKRLYAVADKRKVHTRWVRGHNGDRFNEMADALATTAVAEGRKA